MNSDANWGSWWLTICCGIPCNFQISSQYISASWLDIKSVLVAFSRIIFENQSMMTRIASLSPDFGSGPMRSMLISSHGAEGTGKGCSGAAFFPC